MAVSAVFAGNGSLFGSLFARLPEVQERLELSEGELGLALLAAPVGLIGAVALAGAGIARVGSRRVSAVGAAGYAGLLVLPGVAPSLGWLAAALLGLGAASGVLDVAMNTQGITVERRYPRRIFASLHAAFAFGALAGSGTAGLLASAGVPLAGHLLGAGAVVGLVFVASIRAFVPDGQAAGRGEAFARPTRALAALGAIALCALLAEGALNDWTAVYLARELDAGPGTAAAGLAAFSLAMGTGRLAGDPLAERLGARRLARGGLLVAGAGFAAAAFAPGTGSAILSLVLLGLGLAAVFPLCLRAATGQGDVAPSAALAAVTTLGYVGFLIGPPLVGLLAEAASLRASLLAIAGLCLAAAVAARVVVDPAVR